MKKAYLSVWGILLCALTFAQEKSAKINVDINKGGGGGDGYGSPLLWIIGAIVFILLLVALTSGGSRRGSSGRTDKVTVKKTVQTDRSAG